jgi:hypothetical protein
MTMKTSTFVDNSFNFVQEVGDLKSPTMPDMEVEYCTILQHNEYQIRLLHECRGIGMSDRYYYHTVLEVCKNGEFFTDKLADLLWINMPIDTSESINKVMKWIYSNA